MIERRRAQPQSRPRLQGFAGDKVMERDVTGKNLRRHREKRRRHELSERIEQRHIRQQVPGP